MRELTPLLLPALLAAQTVGTAPPADPDPARAFFARPSVTEVRIDLTPEARQALRDRPREYAAAALRIDGEKAAPPGAGVKLKGAAGSFQKIDEHPGFTVNLGKFGGAAMLHGLKRFHLNNCAQDPSLLCEWLGNMIFAAAGYPAPRVAHAHVWLDGQDLGLYVLREGLDRQFLVRSFGDAHGNLYDGGFCQDIDSDLEKDAGDGPDDHEDLHRLRELCRGFDAERTTRLERAVDVPAFVDFMALEAMVGHWDGYCQNRNNFRLWLPTAPGAAKFLPHGMDQIFGDAEAAVLDHPPALVASAVAQTPAWRKLYRDRLAQLLPLFAPAKWRTPLAARAAMLEKELARTDKARAAEFATAAADLAARVEARHRFLQKAVRASEPEAIAFRGDEAVRLTKWNAAGETDGIALKKRSFQDTPALQLAIDGRGADARLGSFRTTVLLRKGRYQLTGSARCAGVEGLRNDDGSLHGGVRLAVGDGASEKLYGDRDWTALACEFEVAEFQRVVELRLELKAHAGTAWFRVDSLRLRRLGD
ncbi:MAG: CotH kinase family protein [Planctomycetota bacterium]